MKSARIPTLVLISSIVGLTCGVVGASAQSMPDLPSGSGSPALVSSPTAPQANSSAPRYPFILAIPGGTFSPQIRVPGRIWFAVTRQPQRGGALSSGSGVTRLRTR